MKIRMVFKIKMSLAKLEKRALHSLLYLLKEYNGVELDFAQNTLTVVSEEQYAQDVRKIIDSYFCSYKVQIYWPDEGEEFDEEEIPVKLAEKQLKAKYDFYVKGIVCENERLRQKLKEMERVMYWLLSRYNVSEDVIAKYVISTTTNLYLEYNPSKFSENDLKIGDLVQVIYGKGLSGEVQGAKVVTVIIDIFPNGMFYGVPVLSGTKFESLRMQKEDFEYVTEEFNTDIYNFAVPSLGRYMSIKRIADKVGMLNSAALEKIIESTRKTHDFSYNMLYSSSQD